ncbi:hypothetical protein ABENE_00435 [Asticcacaulis benevestitus DSM 16100 = ATCC BAA-896]|uniref:CAAX prenyl protease 2/Lysostaphin resistance protein A-like domain-containing protein n=1 Tax=Asticcacaulis benevestitus DSM 16100 = ATCC BAA-896 TaxID=1121022 RepID=V4PKW2_9CAUL|nr:hypothetical protein ABENE_00435 [Asticcacaulis benevestitus DSM 16100 = ATCC BAA-896]
MILFHRLKRAVLTWPEGRQWRVCFIIGAVCLVFIAAIGGFGGLLIWQPLWHGAAVRLVMVMAMPAFTEELVFRGVLVPDKGEIRRPVLWIGLAVLVFMLWHVFEAVVILPNAQLFLASAFLICAGVLGLACTIMRYHTGSLWPAVLFHGLVVWLWQTLLGGPDIAQLMG